MSNKYAFIERARSLNLSVPFSFLITSREQLLQFNYDCSYICKPATFASLHHEKTIILPRSTPSETIEYINRLSISEHRPYLLQKYLSGQQYSTHVTAIDGKIKLFVCSPKSTYQHVDQPIILQWCMQYVQTLNLTGHLSMKFIIDDHDGQVYAIECHSHVDSNVISFYNHPQVASAYFEDESSTMIVPLTSARQIYWLPYELVANRFVAQK